MPRPRSGGAGAVGFLLVAVPTLMLGLGSVELAHWFSLRQILGHALMQAARSGATQHARPQIIADSFESGLRMAWPDPRSLRRILHEHESTLGVAWHIRITQPARAAFRDHADPRLRVPHMPSGLALINNDHQALQQARYVRQGWPQGRGPVSGQTIFEANTLAMTLDWPQRPLLPGTGALLRTLAPWASDPLQARWMAAGYLPFRRHIRLAMHSHPAQWPDLADGRISHGTATPAHPAAAAGPAQPNPYDGFSTPAPASTRPDGQGEGAADTPPAEDALPAAPGSPGGGPPGVDTAADGTRPGPPEESAPPVPDDSCVPAP
ncbi:TadE/TadG family type IV pilus assembly protein [Castellaniella sp.]|uniref:TadE/TadG family type IV pilus assembly protein n=1 Tax=Castellaniella sp. TaxID=1955812 RepID=UPI003564E096